jgi:hypothetical protein
VSWLTLIYLKLKCFFVVVGFGVTVVYFGGVVVVAGGTVVVVGFGVELRRWW